ncbi:MAG: class I SAM-dependent methyltransferase [Bacillota bacterium]
MYNFNKIAVTTSQEKAHLIETAQEISSEIKVNYIPRNKLTINKLKEKNNLKHLIVVREDKITVDNNFFFHPGMAVARIKMLKSGQDDPMINAMALKPGSRVLDCTVGLATDSIVASFVAGEEGEIVGIESSPIIYIVTKLGLKSYTQGSKDCRRAMERINIYHNNYEEFLQKQGSETFDVVYFDPMFDTPCLKSSGIEGLRTFANYKKLLPDSLEKALKIARDRVVIKDRKDSGNFQRLKVDEISGGKYSSINYGIIYK